MSWNSRTNRISIKWVNHNGWIDIFVIKKTTSFVRIFDISPCVFTQFWSGELVGCGIWFYIQRVPTLHNFGGLHYPKKRNTWKNLMMASSSCFLRISCFWGSGVHQKYAVWVLVGCRIKFRIQRALPIKIWVKTQGVMSKIRTQKVAFFFLPPKLINIILLF